MGRLRYESVEAPGSPGNWLVRLATRVDGRGRQRPSAAYIAVFGGPEAERRARDYAARLEAEETSPASDRPPAER